MQQTYSTPSGTAARTGGGGGLAGQGLPHTTGRGPAVHRSTNFPVLPVCLALPMRKPLAAAGTCCSLTVLSTPKCSRVVVPFCQATLSSQAPTQASALPFLPTSPLSVCRSQAAGLPVIRPALLPTSLLAAHRAARASTTEQRGCKVQGSLQLRRRPPRWPGRATSQMRSLQGAC